MFWPRVRIRDPIFVVVLQLVKILRSLLRMTASSTTNSNESGLVGGCAVARAENLEVPPIFLKTVLTSGPVYWLDCILLI
jgi:hypothetical protein